MMEIKNQIYNKFQKLLQMVIKVFSSVINLKQDSFCMVGV